MRILETQMAAVSSEGILSLSIDNGTSRARCPRVNMEDLAVSSILTNKPMPTTYKVKSRHMDGPARRNEGVDAFNCYMMGCKGDLL